MKPYRLLLIGAAAIIFVGCSASKKTEKSKITVTSKVRANVDPSYTALREKYAKMLNVTMDSITNVKLYAFVDEWLNTPYKWGGDDKNGIDCSAFIQKLLLEVYDISIPRTSVEQFFTKNIEKFRRSRYLVEGDLVFFHTVDERTISHVGLYLCNRQFVNASSKGVTIANLDDNYWRAKYVSAGRVKLN
jgi:cell wall-associated NlpC family hydrolase